jgi:hypothetical protein
MVIGLNYLGYRRGANGGVWRARWLTDIGYNKTSLGTADDVFNADRQSILNFTWLWPLHVSM